MKENKVSDEIKRIAPFDTVSKLQTRTGLLVTYSFNFFDLNYINDCRGLGLLRRHLLRGSSFAAVKGLAPQRSKGAVGHLHGRRLVDIVAPVAGQEDLLQGGGNSA